MRAYTIYVERSYLKNFPTSFPPQTFKNNDVGYKCQIEAMRLRFNFYSTVMSTVDVIIQSWTIEVRAWAVRVKLSRKYTRTIED